MFYIMSNIFFMMDSLFIRVTVLVIGIMTSLTFLIFNGCIMTMI